MLVSLSSSFQNQDIEETDSIGCPSPNENDNTIVIAASVSAFVFLVGIGMFVHVKTKKDLKNRSFPTIWQKSLLDNLLDEWSGVSPDAHTGVESCIHVSNLTAGDFAPNVTGSFIVPLCSINLCRPITFKDVFQHLFQVVDHYLRPRLSLENHENRLILVML